MLRPLKLAVSCCVLAVIIFYGGPFALGVAAKIGLERQGAEMFGVPVSVERVRLDLLKGEVELTELSLVNPEGYRVGEALGVSRLYFDLTLSSLLGSPIKIDNVIVEHARATYEVNERAIGNLNVLLERLSGEDNTSRNGDTGQGSAPAGKKKEAKIRVDQVLVVDTVLTLDMQAFGGKRAAETLSEFRAEKIGGETGLVPHALGREMARILLKNILLAAERKYKERVKTGLRDKLMEALQEGVGEKIESFLEKF